MNYLIRGENKKYYTGKDWQDIKKAKIYKNQAAVELAFSELVMKKQNKAVPFPLTRVELTKDLRKFI